MSGIRKLRLFRDVWKAVNALSHSLSKHQKFRVYQTKNVEQPIHGYSTFGDEQKFSSSLLGSSSHEKHFQILCSIRVQT